MTKPLAFALALLLLLTTLAGCTPKTPVEETSPQETAAQTTPPVTTPEETTPEEEAVIPPTEKELTDVSIISGESETEQLAAAELKKHLEIKGVSVGSGGFPITLSIDPTLGDDAYRIEGSARLTPEENRAEFVNITGGNGRGVYYGVVRFLEEYAGTRFFTYELETHTADPVTLPQSFSIEY